MKFLVRRRAIQPIPLAPGDLAALALQRLDYWERLSKSSLVLFTAPFVGRRARVAIYEAASNEELFGLINDDPLFPYLECEVVPLTTNEQIWGSICGCSAIVARVSDREQDNGLA
jgi:muconolactone delta-isomerase